MVFIYDIRDEAYNFDGFKFQYTYSDTFLLKIHHGGEFTATDYVCGKFNYVDNLNVDEMSTLELDNIMKQLKYQGSFGYYYKKKGCADFHYIMTDDDLLSMLVDHVPNENDMEIWVKHRYQSIDMPPTQQSRVDKGHQEVVDVSDGEMEKSMQNQGERKRDREGCEEGGSNSDDEGSNDKDNNNEGSDVEDSNEEDSDYEEEKNYKDSDYEQSEEDVDDNLFETNVDEYTEWAGDAGKLKGRGATAQKADDGDDYSETEYQASDDVARGYVSDDDATSRPNFESFNPLTEMADPKFFVGKLFGSTNEFREAITNHALKQRKDIKFGKSENNRVRAVCYGAGFVDGDEKKKKPLCPWACLISLDSTKSSFQVKTYNPKHTCGKPAENALASAKYLSRYYRDEFKMNPRMPIQTFLKKVQKDFQIDVGEYQFYRVRKLAFEMIDGDFTSQYNMLGDYKEEILRTNPGSTVEIMCELDSQGKRRFQRIYVCLAGLKKGFLEACRPVICLDGCFLKGPAGGQLLSAVGVDANNGMWPIAWAIVEGEKRDSWEWFLTLLVDDLSITNDSGWTFMSDKQKGLVDALVAKVPGAEHRFCVRHLLENMKVAGYKDHDLRFQVWKLSKISNILQFEREMDVLKSMNEGAYKWLSERPARQWSRSHFQTFSKCNIVTNNIAESFNGKILREREQPVLGLLEGIRQFCMKRLTVKREAMRKTLDDGTFCPQIADIWEKKVNESSNWMARGAGQLHFQVEHSGGSMCAVDLSRHACSCRTWDLSGIPCEHAIGALYVVRAKPEDYICDCYRKSVYMTAYENIIFPLNSKDMWPRSNMPPTLPPSYHRKPGRPPVNRRRAIDEPKKGVPPGQRLAFLKLGRTGNQRITCTKCGQLGHNKRRCAVDRQVDVQPSAKKGRPRVRNLQDPLEGNAPASSKRGRPRAAQQAAGTGEETGQNVAYPKGKPRGGKGKRKKLGHGMSGIPPVAPPRFAGSTNTQPTTYGAPPQSRDANTAAQGVSSHSGFGNMHFISTNSQVNKVFHQTSNTVSISGLNISSSLTRGGKSCVTASQLQAAAKQKEAGKGNFTRND